MPLRNNYLVEARKSKNDEFYTLYEDIEKEVLKFKNKFEGKVVYCPCDTPDSNFVKFFKDNFDNLKLKELYYSSNTDNLYYYTKINGNERTLTVTNFYSGTTKIDVASTPVDITTDKFIKVMNFCDIIVTNPPFSLFVKFLQDIIDCGKEYLIIGQQNTITCKSVFENIMSGKTHLDYGFKGIAGWFKVPDNYVDYATTGEHKEGLIRVSGVIWYTSFNIDNTRPLINLKNSYYNEDGTPNNEKYKFFDNFRAISGLDEDCINVGKIKDIPCDYYGYMGVPITIMGKYNPNQFEIIQLDHYGVLGNLDNVVEGKQTYRRVYVKLRRN